MGIRRSSFCGALPSPSQPAIPRPTCAREPAPLRSGSARPCMRHTLSRPHLPVATDATSADFPRAVCRRKALKGERGPTPLHPGGPPLGGPTSSASSTRRAANVFVRRLPCRGCACVYLCECVCLGGRVCVAAPCEPSRASHACGPPQQILGSRAGPCPASVVCVLAGQLPCFCFCFCGSRVVSVRSVRVALVSRVCLRTSQSTFVITFPKLHMYALL